ncbi:MAG: hypothetical protein DMG26_04655 [Acidobacteria bacterium]|nr:MAG: hypothetical protein DMG26_04655 [Acidobacteriota bacterium]
MDYPPRLARLTLYIEDAGGADMPGLGMSGSTQLVSALAINSSRGTMKAYMVAQAQFWMPAVLALFGTLIVVVFTAWLNSRMLAAKVDALRAEMKQAIAELELRLSKQIMELGQRIDRLEEARGLVRP